MIWCVDLVIFSVTRVSTVKSRNTIQPFMHQLVGRAVLRKVDSIQPPAMTPGLIQKYGSWGTPGSLLELGQHCASEKLCIQEWSSVRECFAMIHRKHEALGEI